ncbi:MAG: radical SAM family heme chaperone HemW [Deltaproteobacteria bacterium]|nr:radical SAM family heme chaperone HemW [Deltaproteobacteria bacterium]
MTFARNLLENLTDKKIGLYVHVPFCRRHCPYCDFPVTVKFEENYFVSLTSELNQLKNLNLEIETIYFGGGTPSMYPDFLKNLLEPLFAGFNISQDVELTVETNPEDLKNGKYLDFLALYKPRVSLGIQALDDRVLRFLGRAHKVGDVLTGLDKLCSLGLTNINGDFIFGVPTRFRRKIVNELLQALHNLKHVSVYLLTVEPGTFFFEKSLKSKIDKNEFLDIYELLTSLGFEWYELSNFAKPNYMSKHNIKYWRHDNVLGIGLGAVSFLRTSKGLFRLFNTKSMSFYNSSQNKVCYFEELKPEDLCEEEIIFGLRTIKGLSLPKELLTSAKIIGFVENGFLEQNGTKFRVSPKGFPYADYIISVILDELKSLRKPKNADKDLSNKRVILSQTWSVSSIP